MGFMDKAKAAAQDAAKKSKELADQAQKKLDETQNNFNSSQSQSSGTSGSGVQYDKHGRPIADEATVAETVEAPQPAAEVAPQDTAPPHGDPLAEEISPPAKPKEPSDNSGMTSGDPLAG